MAMLLRSKLKKRLVYVSVRLMQEVIYVSEEVWYLGIRLGEATTVKNYRYIKVAIWRLWEVGCCE